MEQPSPESPRSKSLTIEQLWVMLTGEPASTDILSWAPDVAALTTVLLERSHAFRFVVSPPEGGSWPPAYDEPFAAVVRRTAAQWCSAMGRSTSGDDAPELVQQLWGTLTKHLDTPLADVAAGRPWEVCEAALALHAIADEASAGCAGPLAPPHADPVHSARAREMLVRTGTMARFPEDRMVHVPKIRTTPVGITHRSLSRYTSTTNGGIPVVWHRAPIRRQGTAPTARQANVLLLPWPLRIRESDFVPVPGSVRRPEREPFGFFHYAPSQPLDVELVDRLLTSARDEVDGVDVVVLPEGGLNEEEVVALETVLARHQVSMLVSGIREKPPAPDRFPGNSVHVGVRVGEEWSHHRQSKHHRWFLDGAQIEQYNIAGALHPTVKWWEAMDIPKRSVHILELGAGVTVAAVVCEDLARLDGVSELLRSVGPTLVVTLLLDGPQLGTRWTARYASVLADDPGSSVLTLTAYGMVARSRPHGVAPSNVVALWKDPVRGLREIPLEGGSQGVLLKTMLGRSARYAADGRNPADDATDLYVAGVNQVRAADPPPDASPSRPEGFREPVLDAGDLSVLYSWAEAAAQTIMRGEHGRHGDPAPVLRTARAGAPWRGVMGLDEPSPRLDEALAELQRQVEASLASAAGDDVDELLESLRKQPREPGDHLGSLVRASLGAALDAARVSRPV